MRANELTLYASPLVVRRDISKLSTGIALFGGGLAGLIYPPEQNWLFNEHRGNI